jgi:hypothetical protein
LPLERHGGERQATEIAELIEWLKVEKPAESLTIFVNHVDESEIDSLRDRYPEVKIRSRVGTKLWLGDAKALTITGTVIAVESVPRGKRFGYRQRKFRADAKIITVVGGTAHGVGLQAPKMARGGERLKTLYRAGMAAFNRNLSPFSWNDQKLLFAEPPHMSVSLLVLPKGVRPPAVGEELSASLRFTTTRFDRVSRSPSTD